MGPSSRKSCFIAGCIFQLMVERAVAGTSSVDPRLRNALMVGFLGGFTTFSAFSLQALELLQDGEIVPALGYMGGSVALCLLGTWGGWALGRL